MVQDLNQNYYALKNEQVNKSDVDKLTEDYDDIKDKMGRYDLDIYDVKEKINKNDDNL